MKVLVREIPVGDCLTYNGIKYKVLDHSHNKIWLYEFEHDEIFSIAITDTAMVQPFKTPRLKCMI